MKFALLWLASAVFVCHISAQEQLLREAARLDSEQKCAEAERVYQQALAAGTPSPALLNNLGNHYLICREPEKARGYFERLLRLNPADVNANLQLARLAAEKKQGARALQYLSHVGGDDPAVLLIRAEALQQTGQTKAAGAILDGLFKDAGNDPRLLFAIGMTCGRAGLYGRAESAFSAVLAHAPDDFDVLYNFGLAASRAGHSERARSALEVALKMRPGDVDSLYELGRVYSNLQDYNRAVYVLAQARKAAPQRADICLALARATQMAGYYGDSILAYDSYLKLKPGDDLVRRDRALLYGFSRAGRDQGLQELKAYVQKHPRDAVGFYDLAQLLDRVDRAKALECVSTAVRLDPRFEPARYYRAWLLQKLGRSQESASDLEVALRIKPDDARAMDLLGLDKLDLGKPAEAEKVLRRALALSPNSSEVLFHLGRSLIELGRAQEAKPFLDRFQQVRQQPPRTPREEPGVIESATLSREERERRTIEQLRQLVHSAPVDPAVRINLGNALLSQGHTDEGDATFRELLALNPASGVCLEAGTILLRLEQYPLARDFLERAAASLPKTRLDLAIALFFANGPDAALQALDRVPENQDPGDYLLMKAQILDAAGKTSEAETAIARSLEYTTLRPRLAEQGALLLLRHGRAGEALRLLDRTLRSEPGDASLRLARVTALNSAGRSRDAEQEVKEIENRWPEWDRPYVIEGLLLAHDGRAAEARQRIQIAFGLGTREPAARCALAAVSKSHDSHCSCQPGIFEPFFPPCPSR